jgi:phage repressor protein C with HTH and peptisase S24 domain
LQVRVLPGAPSDNKHYPEYERTADEIHIVGRIRWFAREI